MIRINAAFVDMINLCLFRQKQLDTKEFDRKTTENEYDLSEVSISFVKDLLNNNPPENCKFVSYPTEYGDSAECVLIVQRQLTDAEKQKEIEDCKSNLCYAKHRLLKWMEKPENKDMILTYLDHENIKIEGVN